MYAAWMPSRTGEAWEDWEDAKLHDDVRWGADLLALKMRSRRTFEEVEQRLATLGLQLRPPADRAVAQRAP